ncbi:MAG: MarR family transcriptional regulator [Actinomycetota bacterium]|nr:MarR family transcriptional regulator [Actinomycetota bacterium]
MTGARWLDVDELHAWRMLQLMQLQLTATLSRELAEASGPSYQDYLVLAALTDRPGGRMRAFELGRELGWEKSRLSHHVARMVERGLVRRERCQTDQRGAFVVVTKQGRKAIEGAAPGHVQGVRRHFIDLVSPSELEMLSTVAARVLEKLADDDAGRCG